MWMPESGRRAQARDFGFWILDFQFKIPHSKSNITQAPRVPVLEKMTDVIHPNIALW